MACANVLIRRVGLHFTFPNMDLMKWVRKRPRTPDSEESGGSDQQSTNNSADVANVNIANNSPKSVPVKKRKTGIDSDWVKEFPWLLVVDDERGTVKIHD